MIALAVLPAAVFLVLGTAKLLALPRMRALAAHAGFSVTAYRGIGTLEVAGAAGLLAGPAVPVLGVAAGGGLLLLLAGAVVTHVRHRDEPSRLVPALVCAALVAGYLVALEMAS